MLDWEYAAVSWLPFDWFHYICSVILDREKRKATSPESALALLKTTFGRRNPQADVIRGASSRLLQDIGLCPTLYPQLHTIGLFDFLRRRFGDRSLPSFLPLFRHICDDGANVNP